MYLAVTTSGFAVAFKHAFIAILIKTTIFKLLFAPSTMIFHNKFKFPKFFIYLTFQRLSHFRDSFQLKNKEVKITMRIESVRQICIPRNAICFMNSLHRNSDVSFKCYFGSCNNMLISS